MVGYKNILKAIHEVWASPFDERAYGWRQSHMENPEYVFPAVVIQLAYAGDKSGVMVTTDIEDHHRPGWVSVAVSEGVGGAVEGQATESVLIDTVQEADPAPRPGHGAREDGSQSRGWRRARTRQRYRRALLTRAARRIQLIALSKKVKNLDSLRDENGNIMPADMEFSFKNGTARAPPDSPLRREQERAQRILISPKLDSGTSSGHQYGSRSAQQHSPHQPSSKKDRRR